MDTDRIASIEKITALVKVFTNLNSYESLIDTIKINIDNIAKNDSTGLYLYDEDEKKLKLFYAKGFSAQEKQEAENSAMDRHPGHVFRTAEILWINDQDTEKNPISIDSKKKSHTRSRIYVPVVSNNKTIGAFGMQSEQPFAYHEKDITLLKLFASLAADAYDSIKKNILINKQNEENSKLSILAKNTVNHIIYADKHGKITWVNKHFEDFTGYKLEDIIGRTPGSFLCGEATEWEHTNELSLAIKEKKQCNVTITNYKKNGDLYNVSIQLTPTFNLKGEHDGFISIQQDVTELIKNKIELNNNLIKITESENAYNHLVNTSTELILIIDATGILEFVNDTWLKETNFNRDEVIGTNIFNYIHLDDHEHCISFINNINKEKTKETFVSYSIVGRNGNKIELEGSLVATFKNNELSKINSFLKNVTILNKLKAENKTRENETENNFKLLKEISAINISKFENRDSALKFILEAFAKNIVSSRVSIWTYENETLACIDIVQSDTLEHSNSNSISEKDFPIYFKAIKEQIIIHAPDAHSNKYTHELSNPYLTVLGINSILDIPIKTNNTLWGVLCIEYIGKEITWSNENISFAKAFADIISNVITSFQLNEKSTKIQSIMSSLNETVWGITLPTYELEYVSNSVIELYGYPISEWKKNKNLWSDVIYFEDKERVLKENEKLFFTGETFSEYRIITADNKIKWIYNNTKVITDQNGSPILMTRIAGDITERKKIENELKNYKIAIDHSAIVSITDTKGNITYANDQFCKISQYSLEELIGSNHRIIKSDKHSTAFYKNIWETISKGEIWRGEIINKAKDNSEYHVESTIVPFMKNGKPREYIAIRYESTEKAKFKYELEKQKLFYENILNYLPVDIAVFNRNHQYIYLNKEAVKNDELRQWMIGKDDFEYAEFKNIPNDFAIERRTFFNKLLETGNEINWIDKQVSGEELKYKERRFHNVESSKIIIGYGVDVTNFKIQEEIISASLVEKESLLGEIHHRVKNNLALIDGLVELKKIYEKNDSFKSTLSDVQSRIKTIALVHEELYKNSDFENIELKKYLTDLTNFHKTIFYKANESRVEFTLDIGHITIDNSKCITIGLLINELISNSLKYALINKIVTVEIEIRDVIDNIIIDYKDSGNGLPDKVRIEKEFGYGLRLLNTFTRQLKGEFQFKDEKHFGIEIIIPKEKHKNSRLNNSIRNKTV
jgi:PAS domain S-box-containing protein